MKEDSSLLEPLPPGAWDRGAAAHLLNRTGFGARPGEIDAAVRRGLPATLDRLFEFNHTPAPVAPPAWVTPEAERRPDLSGFKGLSDEQRRMKQQELRRTEAERMRILRDWWLRLMRSGDHPLREKLTLFWHGHFATSEAKVRSAYAMWRQNQTLREHAAGNWRTMLQAMSRDPAMLVWLDGARSQRRAPNENFARELMELFTLGEGRYAEEDVREAARAFTGGSLERDRWAYRLRPNLHDGGEKTVLGATGRLDGDGVVDAILARPASAEFLALKIWQFFVSPVADPATLSALAAEGRRAHHELEPLLRTLFSSRVFFSDRFRRAHIKSPVQWMIGTLRMLDLPLPPPRRSLDIQQALGQVLFEPPNVKGWDGGMAWLTSSSLLDRYRIIGELFRGSRKEFMPLAPAPDPRGSRDDGVRQWCLLVFQDPLTTEDRAALAARLPPAPMPEWREREIRDALQALMSSVYYQMV